MSMAKIKVYLDNCSYNRPFDDQSQVKVALETEAKRYIQQLIVEKTIDLTYSYVNRFENDDNPHTARQNSIKEFFKNAVVYIDSNHAEKAEKIAASIMKSGVKPKDALHLACAIEGCCDYFITTDKPLLKYQSQSIVLCNPVVFLDYLEETNNA
jgi:predicted nucleic acid-binding protein